MSDSSYSYIDAPASAIELNTNKISEMSEEQTYDKEYPNAEAVKDYVAEHSGGEDVEHTTNKVTSITAQSTDIQYPSAKAVKTELDKKLDLAGGTMSNSLGMGGYAIKGLGAPENDTDATNKKYVDDSVGAIPVITVDNALSNSSENPVQNRIVTSNLSAKISKGTESGTNTLAVGAGSKATAARAIAIQNTAEATDTDTIAIGYGAKATAQSSIQIGFGTNNTANTAQIFGYQLLDNTGKIPSARLDLSAYEQTANKVTAIDENNTDTQYPSAKAVYDGIDSVVQQLNNALPLLELKANKVTSISAQSTDTEYPSAKCVYDAIAAALIVDTEEVIP